MEVTKGNIEWILKDMEDFIRKTRSIYRTGKSETAYDRHHQRLSRNIKDMQAGNFETIENKFNINEVDTLLENLSKVIYPKSNDGNDVSRKLFMANWKKDNLK